MNKTVKVLHYGLSENKGGIENLVFSWLKQMPENIHFDFVNDTTRKLGFEDEFIKMGCKIYQVTHRYKNPFKHYFELKRLIEAEKYDYIHVHVMTMIEPVQAFICEKNKKCSAIYHCHSMYKGVDFSFKEKFLQSYTKVALKNKHIYRLSCGKDAGEFMFKDKKFVVIENGVDFDNFKFNQSLRNTIRKKLNIKDDEILIGHVGHECVEKNYPFMFETFTKVAKNGRYKLLLIGNMDKSERIVKMIDDYGIKNSVIFTGMINNVKDYYSAMDVFYLPSINEGFPVVLVEAQVSGLPCIVSSKVTKDTKISDNFKFIKLDISEAVKTIENIKLNENRSNLNIDNDYDLKDSSNKLFNFYLNNLKS